MLLVWKGSETSHYLGGKHQNYLQRTEFHNSEEVEALSAADDSESTFTGIYFLIDITRFSKLSKLVAITAYAGCYYCICVSFPP